ncbi:hypothetical protein ACK85E_004315 [Salmonella enterica]|nr:hypothetical protein [Salmonella enterica]EMD3331635.1 hypothetical protein [Salmonella enterica]EMD3454524.1 hypothetical protein [Salmonella enterica]EMD3627838.1 hypothetical protein [Salmonella enterica]EMD3711799.1 hypothetical protein [Salmonella enterica]
MTVITGISDVKKSWVGRIKPQPCRMQEQATVSCRVFMPEATAGIVAMAVYKKQKPGL